MSWENNDFEPPNSKNKATAAKVANAAPIAKPKKVSLEARSFQKQKARAMEEKAELEAAAAAAAAAVEKAKAGAKGTAASKAYIASLQKKAKTAANAVAAKEMDIIEASVKEGQRLHNLKCMKKGIMEANFERNVLGVIRNPNTGEIMYYEMCGR